MKKLCVLTLFLIFSASNIFSQSGWFWQNPLPQGNDLNCVRFLNDNTGWAVGKKGTIIKTTDSGSKWMVLNSQTTEILNNVLFVNESLGIVVGEKGTVLRTNNGGLNWAPVFPLNNSNFNGIFFQNQLTGWICGYNNDNSHGVIYKTTNSGLTWNLNFTSPYDERFCKIHFINSNYGFVGSGTSLFRTSNGGLDWQIVNYLSSSIDFDMVDSLNIFFAGGYTIGTTTHGTIRKTTNGGINLTVQINLTDTFLYSVKFINSSTGFVCGQKGKILKTTNFGLNWVSIQSAAYANLKSIYFKDMNNGIIAGDFGTLYTSSNSGNNWSLLTGGIINSNLSSAVFVNSNTGIAVGQNYILKTTNSGNLWNLKFDNPSLFWNKLQMLNINDGFASCNTRFLYKTTNTGENWLLVADFGYGLTSTNYVYSFQFINSETGYAAGYTYNAPPFPQAKSIFKTLDGGLNWTRIYSGGEGKLYDLHFINENTGISVGYNNVLKTINGGSSWNAYVSTSATYNKVFCLDSIYMWVIGSESILKSENGGLNWQTQFTQPGESFSSIKFINENTGWVTSRIGNLYATSNGGINWFYQNTPNHYGLNDAYFISPDTGWVFGDKGIILKTTSGVIYNALTPNSEIIPKSFSLHQNYPNPFNPATKIKFDIPKHSNAKIIIYDLLGREVTTLVNEQLKPGSYEIDWDGSGYASGVYFYSLIADHYTQTKKMILMK